MRRIKIQSYINMIMSFKKKPDLRKFYGAGLSGAEWKRIEKIIKRRRPAQSQAIYTV